MEVLPMVVIAWIAGGPVSADWRGQSCTSDWQCTATNAVCFLNECLCRPGYYYSNYDEYCTGTCSQFDPHGTYMAYPHSGIDNYNYLGHITTSVQGCMDICTGDPRCLTFESDGNMCHPQDATPLTVGSDWNPGSDVDWTNYQKTCGVHKCQSLPAFANGTRTCSAARYDEEGSVCNFSCDTGYLLIGSQSLSCPRRVSPQWNGTSPTCHEDCSWVQNHCWPGDCKGTYNLASNCVCRPGFALRPGSAARICDPVVPPNLSTCRVSVTDAHGTSKNSTYIGNNTNCQSQRDEWILTQPRELYFAMKADLTFSMGNLHHYVSRSLFGVVGGEITLRKVDLKGVESLVHQKQLHSPPYCHQDVNSTYPAFAGRLMDCEGPIQIQHMNLKDGESLCADMKAFSGGLYDLQDNNTTFKGQHLFTPFTNYTKRVCFFYDATRPGHCSEGSSPCSSHPLRLSTRLTRAPEIRVHVEGWLDPIPAGGNPNSASHIEKYKLEVHGVDINGTTLSVQDDARANFTLEWDADAHSRGGPYDLTVKLPEEGAARLYAIILEVHDVAGNVAYARRLVLYDNTSTVELFPSATLRVTTANPKSLRWQTDVARNLCVDWKDRFYNKEMRNNNFLKPVNPDTAREIAGHYDQDTGLLPVAGTDNVNGVTKFEITWSRDASARSSSKEILDAYVHSTCLREPLKDGETYDVWIKAMDIISNFNEDSVRVSIDHTGPSVSITGLRGRFGRDALYVHSTSDLSTIVLLVHAGDPHSGLQSLQWTLGTHYLSDDVGRSAVGVQRLDNATGCQGERDCYCPSVGVCEIQRYLFTFTNLVQNNSYQGQHHREYYITITATNHASLQTRQMMDILIDESPPTMGVILEGLSDDDRAEMDFTSSEVMHARWHGFLDHESGILLYRVVLAERCLTDQEMDAANNATEVEQGNAASLKFPGEGRYYSSVVAYNGAMEPSRVACSDGIVYDTTPPRLVNVSITHARTESQVACTQPDQPWLVNTNMTRVRLARTSDCLKLCSQNSSAVDVGYLPISSNHTLENEASDHFCRTLPIVTEDSYIVLPSDYLKLTWAAVDAESEVEEYYVGMGTDRTTTSAPDLLPFTPTHGHHSYHARHSGLGHGAVFFIFLRALSKAGLDVQLTLGPVIIDVTPPDVTQPLSAVVDGDFLAVSWTDGVFVDLEQPTGSSFDVIFRVGYGDNFVTSFISIPESVLSACHHDNHTGCARYPIKILQSHDTEEGRFFFFQLHVTNGAGHVTTINSSSVRLPAHFPPSHAVIYDVIPSETSFTADNATVDAEPKIQKDVDVTVKREEVCIAWHGLYREDDLDTEVGIGSSPDQDDLLPFIQVENTDLACINSSSLPVYVKLFSVVRATSPGGSTVFSSDGFYMIPSDDLQNKLKVFSGKGCRTTDVVGWYVLNPATPKTIDMAQLLNVSLHPGDIFFLKFTPSTQHVVFGDAVLLQTTLTGYQVVVKSSGLTAVLPNPVTTSTTLELMACLNDAAMLPIPEGHVTVTWELAGPWTNFAKHLKVKVTDDTCLRMSQKKDNYKHQYCLLDGARVSPTKRETKLRAQNVIQNHEYVAIVEVCLDDSCLPAVRSAPFVFSTMPRSVLFNYTAVLSQSPQDLAIELTAGVVPSTSVADSGPRNTTPCISRWTVARDAYGAHPITDWLIEESSTCCNIQVRQHMTHTKSTEGNLYMCLQPVFPWRADNPTCHRLVRPGSINHMDPLHVIELPHTILRQTNFEQLLHSRQLGSKLHDLYDLDLDFARSDVMLSAVVTYSEGRNVTLFLMTDPHVPNDGSCAGDPACVTSQSDKKGTVVFPKTDAKLQDSHVYFICARLSPRSLDLQQLGESDVTTSDVCGDGVVIDDDPPVSGSVTIRNARSGFLADTSHVVVTWAGFTDVEMKTSYLADKVTLNYSVALGSYPGGEDLAHFVSVGQRTSWTFEHLNIATGSSCFASVRAEDRVGHVTEVWSEPVIIDDTPPTVSYVSAGTVTRENFVPGPKLLVRWQGVEDRESGIELLEVAISTEGGTDDVNPFEYCRPDSNAVEITATQSLVDGHSYVVLLKIVNGAGLTSLTSSEPFVIDSSPPSSGWVWNSAPNTSDHRAYSSEVGVYRVYWSGFSDPHSGLDYYRVGLGSHPGQTDLHPFVYVGLQTSFTWKRDFDQGKRYYVTVETCNKAGLCRVTSSNSMTFDDSPPTPGHVTVGFDGHHSRFLGHNTSLPVQWTGFSDPQTGIQEFWWCVGTTPERSDVIPVTQALLSRATVRAGITLPVATPLYVTVRARNPVGMDTVSVSDSFTVDPTPPDVVTEPHFLSPRDGSAVDSQWDRSVLRLAWQFADSGSPVVSHTINIRSHLTGRLVVDPIRLGDDTKLTLTLDEDHLLLDGDSHWAAVTACNAADLCATAISGLLLVDSTPPVVGTFTSPLAWRRDGNSRILAHVAWTHFGDTESGIAAYYVTMGRKYNGEELSDGYVKVGHDNATHIQQHTLPVSEDLKPGDVIYLTMWAENGLGLRSSMERMAFSVLQDSSNGTSGTLGAVRHSCDASFCTKECTCAPDGQVCKGTVSPCREIATTDSRLAVFRMNSYIGPPSGPQTFTTSAKCLEGHWELSDQKLLSNVSRFEWSLSLANATAGNGIFDTRTEAFWHDVGRNTSAVHCMPGTRILQTGRSYILHVRVWLSSEDHVTFVSSPVVVDHSPPQTRRGFAVFESDVTCGVDIDYVTPEPTITACWDGVFRDAQSDIVQYELWVGSSLNADDLIQNTDMGLNTSWTFSTAPLERGARYHVTVRAVNGAGLMTTAVSDGVTVDVTPPVAGVVFAAHGHTNIQAQTSTSRLQASWHGFQDAHSGVMSYHVAAYDVSENASLTPFRDVGIMTEHTLDGVTLEHAHRYKVVVKARDVAGLESTPVESRDILVDTTAPEGVMCDDYILQEEMDLTYTKTSSLSHIWYSATFSYFLSESADLMKIEIEASSMESGANGYLTMDEMKMPTYFEYTQSGRAIAEHIFVTDKGNKTVTFEVETKARSRMLAKLYGCNKTVVSGEDSVTIHQISQHSVSVCSRIRDEESGIRSILVGVGTTAGGLQVQPLTPVGYSGHMLVNVELQHGLPLYATVHAENHAGQWSRFLSRPVAMDRTPPDLTEVQASLRYEGPGQDRVWAEARWRAVDKESGMVSCTCSLEGQSSIQTHVQRTSHVTPGFCQWQLRHPQHEASVRVTISCVNGVQIHATATSLPAIVLLRPPDLSQATVHSLSNIELISPYSQSDLGVRSSNFSLKFCWNGVRDATITRVEYRFLLDSKPLNEWSPVDAYKTWAVLEPERSKSLSGVITAEVRATNERNMTSETVSASVRLDDRVPSLTGRKAVAALANGNVQISWPDVFSFNQDVTFAVYAGTAEGYGDVINHVITKATSHEVQCAKSLPSLFVAIKAVYANGRSSVYQEELKM